MAERGLRNNSDADPVIDPVGEIDMLGVTLAAKAREDGARGAPAADSNDWSTAEQQILETLVRQRRLAEARRAAIAEKVEQELRAASAAPFDPASACAGARIELRTIAGRYGPEQERAQARAVRAEHDLDRFRRAHDRDRPAIYPDSRILQAGLLLVAAAFEALFSAALFAETDERGLLGGAMTALGLSGANVTLGFLSGFLGLRYLGHKQPFLRIAGGAGLATLAALSLSLNLFAAHWRDKLGAAARTPLDTIDDASWFGLITPQAVILLMLGAGVWVFSALKGYSGFDDPYPDYGKLDRAARDAREDVEERRAEAREALEAAIDEPIEALKERVADLESRTKAGRAAYDAAAAQIQDIDTKARRAAEAGNALIQLYRRENLAARNGAPAPAYFTDTPPAQTAFPDALARAADLRIEADRTLLECQRALNAELESLSAELEALSKQLGAA
jgi:hypothetical protein